MPYRPAPPGSPPRRPYPSDVSDGEWAVLAPLFPPKRTRGQPRLHPVRELLDAIRYVLRGGIAWRALPHDFPPWSRVWTDYRAWRDDGTWRRVHDALHRQVRVAAGRDPEPSAGILDSQSVKTGEKGGPAATTRASTSWGASGSSWSIPRAG